MKTTEWFPADVNPVRDGWYEVIYGGRGDSEMRYYDGSDWLLAPDRAADECCFGLYGDTWRGLTEKAS
ncbi:hypothetical protein PQQ84_22615 [Paraburkholderia strydomiana]|uniref:hypothetical protein n=1 Tax=Paraburkholderia strydomiana TaxID=1245417 RepID=UPI0038BA97FE